MTQFRWAELDDVALAGGGSVTLPDAAVPKASRPLDVLVVEDHEGTRRTLELALGHLGHLVFAAGTIADAKRLLGAFRIDAMVCDIMLPDGDASELLRVWPTSLRRVPAIAISGWPDGKLGERCLRGGFDAFLPKPLHLDVLDRTLDRLTR